jgi:hypothetical protein
MVDPFIAGDVVRVKEAVLAAGRVEMSPVSLVGVGWANEFTVLSTFSTKDGVPCVMLKPCCMFLKNPATGEILCKGHPAEHFQKLRRERGRQRGDKAASIAVPWVGEVAGFEYEEDEEHPKAAFRVMGKEVRLEGAAAKFMKGVLDGYGIKL